MDEIKLFRDKVITNNLNLHQKNFGIIEYGKLVLMPEEFLYLVSNNKIKTKYSFDTAILKFSKKIYNKFIIYSDLRKKGYILKSGLKIGRASCRERV